MVVDFFNGALTKNNEKVVVSNIFCFQSYLGKMPILTDIFQMD